MKKIAHFIIHSKAAPIIAALLCLCTWVFTKGEQSAVLTYTLLFAMVLVGYAFIKINAKFDFNSKHSTFPMTLLFMGCAINPQLAVCKDGMLTLLLMTTAISIVLHTYRKRHAMGSYFMAFALMGTGSLFVPQMLYLIPVLLLSCQLMQSLHLRSTLAALLGALLPYWTAFCVLFLTDNMHHVQTFVEALTTKVTPMVPQMLFPLGEGNTMALSTMSIQLLWSMLLIVPAAASLLYTVNVKVQTRAAMFVQFSMLATFIIAALVLPSLYAPLQPTITLLTAIIGSTMFVGSSSRGQNIWLVVLLLLWLLIASLYVWNSFLTF